MVFDNFPALDSRLRGNDALKVFILQCLEQLRKDFFKLRKNKNYKSNLK
jgi:hypothetical protein